MSDDKPIIKGIRLLSGEVAAGRKVPGGFTEVLIFTPFKQEDENGQAHLTFMAVPYHPPIFFYPAVEVSNKMIMQEYDLLDKALDIYNANVPAMLETYKNFGAIVD